MDLSHLILHPLGLLPDSSFELVQKGIFRNRIRAGIDKALDEYEKTERSCLSDATCKNPFSSLLTRHLPFLNIQETTGYPDPNSALTPFYPPIFKNLNPKPERYGMMKGLGEIEFPSSDGNDHTGYLYQIMLAPKTLLEVRGNRREALVKCGGKQFSLNNRSSLIELVSFFENLWNILVKYKIADPGHRRLTHGLDLSEVLTKTKTVRFRKDFPSALDEFHQGKIALNLFLGGQKLDELFEVQSNDGQPASLTLRQLRESYLKNIGYAEKRGIFYLFKEPPEVKGYLGGKPLDEEIDFSFTLEFLWRSSTPEEKRTPFKGINGKEYSLEKIAEHTFNLTTGDRYLPFETVEDNLHIPMFAISYFAERGETKKLEALKQLALNRIREILEESTLLEYQTRFVGRVGHYTEFLGELADCPLVQWNNRDKEIVARWLDEIKIATPRGFPERSGELAHLVKGLRRIEAGKSRLLPPDYDSSVGER